MTKTKSIVKDIVIFLTGLAVGGIFITNPRSTKKITQLKTENSVKSRTIKHLHRQIITIVERKKKEE